MIEIKKYISNLKIASEEHLTKEYNIDRFQLTDFELINFYLLDQAINKGENLFIKIVNKEDKSDTYLPSFISVAISLFFKNYCETNSSYKVGDILQKRGVRYEIKMITDSKYILTFFDRGLPSTITTTKKKLDRDYLIINANFKNRKVKTKLTHYRNFFKEIFNTENFPSRFSRKAVVIIEKKDFINELKTQTFSSNIKLNKAIPYQWVNKNGNNGPQSIPIDPMIYLVPDYDTFKEYILNNGKNVDMVVAIGKNKYQPDELRKIKKDLREEEIPNAIIIGSENIDDDNKVFRKWNWTIPEVAHFNGYAKSSLSIISVPEDNFEAQIKKFDAYLLDVNKKYDIKLSSSRGFKKLLYSLVLPSETSRIKNQIEYLKYAISKHYHEEIDTALFNQGIDPKDEVVLLNNHIEALLSSFSNSKLSLLDQCNFDYVVIPSIPKDAAEEWNEESKYKTISYKEFLNRLNNVTTRKTFLFLSPFGYKMPHDLFNFIRKTYHNYLFLSYKEEKLVIEYLDRKHQNSLAGELNSSDRKYLSGIEFPYTQKFEDVPHLIDRINEKHTEQSLRKNSYEETFSVNYFIDFDSGDRMILEGNKSVLLESSGQMRRRKVSSLVVGDRVRIYSNLTKELLFETAVNQDTSGRLTVVEENSRCWKKCLKDHYQNGHCQSHEELLEKLQQKGISIRSPITLKNWMNLESQVKFPQKERDLLVIQKTIENDELDEKITDILKSRRVFNGIMIALGRDLSDEIMEYIINRIKGRILSSFSDLEIQSIANTSAPLRAVRSIHITEEDETE